LAIGFLASVGLGVPLGLVLGASARLYAAVEMPLDFFRSLPAMAVFPLFLLAFGLGDPAKIAITTWTGSLIIIVNTMYGVRAAKTGRQAAARAFGASKFQIFTKVVLIDAIPQIVAGLRIAVSLCLIVVVVSEMFMGTKAGIGMTIYNAGLIYDTPRMLAGILVAGLLGYALNKLFVLTEHHFVHWSGH
jgi:NitT/TauT family transport system permease protein